MRVHTPEDVDLLDPRLVASGAAPAVFARLRREAPVSWHRAPPGRGPGFWALTRHADIARVSRDPACFSSGRGTGIYSRHDADPLPPNFRSLNASDPPQHSQLRALLSPAFTRPALSGLLPLIQQEARALLDAALSCGEVDLVARLAAVLPLRVLGHLLGLPPEEVPVLADLSQRLGRHEDPRHRPAGLDGEASWQAAERELWRWTGAILQRARRQPGEDLPSRLLAARLDGASLGEDDLRFCLRLLIQTGHQTTASALGGGALALAERPAQQDRLRADASLIPAAAEEILRWTTPVLRFGRLATCDALIGDQQIHKGDRVVLFYLSANRDEAVFAEPDRFDVGRLSCPHLSLGAGPHHCLGAPLTRMQLHVVLAELRRVHLTLIGAPDPFLSSFHTGLRALPLRLSNASTAATA